MNEKMPSIPGAFRLVFSVLGTDTLVIGTRHVSFGLCLTSVILG